MLRMPFDWYTSGDFRNNLPMFEDLDKKSDPAPASQSNGHVVHDDKVDLAVTTTNGHTETDTYKVMLNLKHFRPEQILVKTVDNFVVIHGKQEESADHHGYISREFTRRYKLPDNVDPKTVSSIYSYPEGTLTVKAPFKQPDPAPKDRNGESMTVKPSGSLKRPHEQSAVQQSESEKLESSD